MLDNVGRLLIFAGAGLIIVGLFFLLVGRLPGFGRLPGDIVIKRENLTVYIPLATMIVASLVLTLILNLIAHWRK